MRLRAAICVLAFPILAPAQTIDVAPTTESGRIIHTLVEDARMDELRWPDFSDYRKHLRNFYAGSGYEMAWVRDGKPTSQAFNVIALLQAADEKGINAVDYDGPRWADRLKTLDAPRFDVALTVALMRYISDLHIGRVNPRNVRFELDIEQKKYYLPALVAEIKGSGAPSLVLAEVEPRYDEYKRLLAALAKYRELAKDDKAIPPAKKLQRLGDLRDGESVDAGVKRFQSRHGLDADGVLNRTTLAALNIPMSQRVRQIQWALERWRWAPSEFARPPIIVNVPEFRLRAGELTMRVVVGQSYGHRTPIFAGDLQYVVFRPYWYVTPNIQRSELVPKVERDLDYLARNAYEVVDANNQPVAPDVAKLRSGEYRVRQKPGPSNALGLVKFMFPNQNNVYLHSTPAQTLFAKSRRDFSHGCIRVEDPAALAEWVLREQPEWTREKIDATMHGNTDNVQVNLHESIPVMILYTTAHVADDGTVHFFDDIYGHDATLENALAAGYPYPP
jgi:murein L,D-transpeptidase YcbB/YkuD